LFGGHQDNRLVVAARSVVKRDAGWRRRRLTAAGQLMANLLGRVSEIFAR
jgi:hypothetical protein